MDLIISTLISVPVGILSSFLFWWWLDRRLAPRVAWSSALVAPPQWSRTGTDDDHVRVKIVNVGRRDAIDLQISAQLRIPRNDDRVGSPMFIVELPTSVQWVPRLQRASYRYVRFCPDRIPESEHARLRGPGSPLTAAPDLAEILASRPDAAVRLYLFAYDSLSGSRKIFVSPDYTLDHVVHGRFEPGTSLTAVPGPDTPPDALDGPRPADAGPDGGAPTTG